jgi:hypothetical protein
MPETVFDVARFFADEDGLCSRAALAENGLRCIFLESAAAAAGGLFTQCPQRNARHLGQKEREA